MKRCFIEETGSGYMRGAIQLHLDGLRDAAYDVPEPHSYSAYVVVPA